MYPTRGQSSTVAFGATLEDFAKAELKPKPQSSQKPMIVMPYDQDAQDDDEEYEEYYYPHIEVVEVQEIPAPAPAPPTPRRRVQVPIRRVNIKDPLAINPTRPQAPAPVPVKRPAILSIGPHPPNLTTSVDPKKTPTRRRNGDNQQAAGRALPAGVKMYELDPNIYPEAANARASYENRIKRKHEKDKIVTELSQLRQRHKELTDENELLKIQLSNAGSHANGSEYIKYLSTCSTALHAFILQL